MWNHLIRRWLDLAFWWLPGQGSSEREQPAEPKTERREPPQQASRPAPAPERPAAAETEPAPQREAAPVPPAAEPAAARPQASRGPDDLTRIKGIGAAMQQRLNAHGIRSFTDLAAADADWLLQQLKDDKAVISRARVEEWIRAAAERGDGP